MKIRHLIGLAVLLAVGGFSVRAETFAATLDITTKNAVAMDIQNAALGATGFGRADDSLPELATSPLMGRSPSKPVGALTAKGEISGSSEGGTAAIKLALAVHSPNDVAIDGEKGTFSWNGYLDTYSLVFSAPVDKSGAASPILVSGGLPSDFKAKFGFSSLIWSGKFNFFSDDNSGMGLREELQKDCKTFVDKQAVDHYWSDAEKEAQYQNLCVLPNTDKLEKYATSGSNKKFTPISTMAWLLGGDATIGYQKFDFYDTVTAAKGSLSRTTWAAKAYIGIIPGSDAPLILAGIEYQDKYKPGTTGTLCPLPAPAPAVLTCVTGALGAPKETRSFVASLEMRRELLLPFGDYGAPALGIDAKFTYDLKSDVYGFDLPLSFAVDKDKNLVGGVDFGWQSDHHEFIVGLFLNSAFTLLPS